MSKPLSIQVYDNKPGWVELRYRVLGEKRREVVKTSEHLTRCEAIRQSLTTGVTILTKDQEAEYKALTFMLNGTSLTEAVTYYLKHKSERKSVGWMYAVVCWGNDEDRRGVSLDTLRTRRHNVQSFFTEAGLVYVNDVTHQAVSDHLANIANPKTRNNVRSMLICFFDWALVRKHYIGDNPAKAVKASRISPKDPVPFSHETLRRLLDKALELREWDALLFLTLGAFAGLRACEIKRLRWEHLQLAYASDKEDEGFVLDSQYIRLSSTITKTDQRRVVPIDPALEAWINLVIKNLALRRLGDTHCVLFDSNPNRTLRKIAEAAGETWVANGLRKGFVTCHTEIHGPALTAKITGHAESVLQSDYKALTTRKEADAWFACYPPK